MTCHRIAALAKLPIFYDLKDRAALVAGGTAGAAWKAELLAAAGARVQVIAPEFDAQMTLLAARGRAAGSVTLERRPWLAADMAGKAIALCDADSDAEAAEFHAAATAGGVPCNVIDRPEYCDFFFGSIVNRTPVMVGISTDGAAPILGQAIRARIEALLPLALAGWTAAAKTIRTEIATRLYTAGLRRRFWQEFVDLAFSAGKPGAAPLRDIARRVAKEQPRENRIRVLALTSTCPDLLTLKAARALMEADVILFHKSVPAEIVELGRREAERVRLPSGHPAIRAAIAKHRRGSRNVLVLLTDTCDDLWLLEKAPEASLKASTPKPPIIDHSSSQELLNSQRDTMPTVSAARRPRRASCAARQLRVRSQSSANPLE